MSGLADATVAGLRVRDHRRALVLVAVVVVATALVALVLRRSTTVALGVVGVGVLLPAALSWLWRSPVRGVYVLFAAAVAQETTYQSTLYADDLGYYTPIFQDISTWTHVKGLSVSIAELFMVLVLLMWLLKGIAERNLRFDRGSLMRPLGLYMLAVLLGEAHGLTSGGNFTLSLWEVRSQVYMFVAYLLACNLVTTRRGIDVLLWIVVAGAGIKGIQGVFRYYVELRGSGHSAESLFPHEQAFFYNALITLTPILFLYGGSRRLKRTALFLLPFVVVASLANQRRAAILAIGVALVGLLVVTAVAHPARHREAAALLCLLAVIWIPYYNAEKTKGGLLAEPARAIYSNSHPDPRDASSNLYRDNENADLMYTMKTSPIIGYGFGKEFYTPQPLADIGGFYVFWKLLPHNSILWIWMRMGTIGYLLFWIVIGTATIQAMRLAVRLQDPYLKGVAVFIGLMIIQEVLLGYLDLQWTSYRNLITLGVLFALLSRLARFAPAEGTTTSHNGRAVRGSVRGVTGLIPPDLAVVDGRLVERPLVGAGEPS